MMLKRLLEYHNRAKRTIELFKERGEYLDSGRYVLDVSLNYVYKADNISIKHINEILLKNNLINYSKTLKYYFKKCILPKYIIIDEKTNEYNFKGTIYLLSNDDGLIRDAKIFNITSQNVLTVYIEKIDLERKISAYNSFRSYFNLPKIVDYSLNDKICIEEMIVSKPKQSWDKEDYQRVIETIFQSYFDYYKITSNTFRDEQNYICPLLELLKADAEICDFACEIERNIPEELCCKKMPRTLQHGDLWLYNILLSCENRIFFIDWEHSDYYSLLYDLFFWMQNEAIYNSNVEYLTSFLTGKYDQYFEQIFSCFDMTFYTHNRKSYLYMFLVEFLSKRVLISQKETKKLVIKQLKELLLKIE